MKKEQGFQRYLDIHQNDDFKSSYLPQYLENLVTVDKVEEVEEVEEEKRNAYLIVYEEKSRSTGGPRWSLRKFMDCTITKEVTKEGAVVTTMKSPHHKDKIIIEKNNNKLKLKWGKQIKEGLEIGTILFSDSPTGGRKKRTRRRKKRTRRRKKRRKKRTKKRR